MHTKDPLVYHLAHRHGVSIEKAATAIQIALNEEWVSYDALVKEFMPPGWRPLKENSPMRGKPLRMMRNVKGAILVQVPGGWVNVRKQIEWFLIVLQSFFATTDVSYDDQTDFRFLETDCYGRRDAVVERRIIQMLDSEQHVLAPDELSWSCRIEVRCGDGAYGERSNVTTIFVKCTSNRLSRLHSEEEVLDYILECLRMAMQKTYNREYSEKYYYRFCRHFNLYEWDSVYRRY